MKVILGCALRLLLALACSSSVACQTGLDVHTKSSPSADFGRYRAFAFGPTESAPDPYRASDRAAEVERRAEAIVSGILESKGYVSATRADLVVRIAAGVRKRSLPIPLPPPLPGGPPTGGWFNEAEAAEILEGALVIDIYDAASADLVWHGAARAAIDPEQIDDQLLRRAIADVLASFPPRR